MRTLLRVLAVVAMMGLLTLASSACSDDSDDGLGATIETGWESVAQVGTRPFESLAAGDDAVVVIGPDAGSGIEGLYSNDGISWEPCEGLPDIEVSFGRHVTGGESGFVIVGTAASDRSPVVVFSPDGASWDRVDPGSLPSSEVSWLTGAVAGPEGFVIVGQRFDEGDVTSGETFMWFSPDGRTWTDTVEPWGGSPSITMAASDAGWVALTGESPGAPRPPAGKEWLARVWVSTDGVEWNELTDGVAWTELPAESPLASDVAAYIGMAPLSATSDTWVLAPEAGYGTARVWVSTDDGVTWEEQVVLGSSDRAGYGILDMTATEFGWFASGERDVPDPAQRAFILVSNDGRTWEQFDSIDGYVDIVAITGFQDQLIALGGDENVYIWNAP